MSKWLLGARKKLGGRFPRPEAKLQMDRYAQKLRNLKMKKAKAMAKKAAEGDTGQDDMKDAFTDIASSSFKAATKALALRWVRMARDSMEVKFRNKSEGLKASITSLLGNMQQEDDWYFGAALRLEGKLLLIYICNFHVLSNLLLIYICKLHWDTLCDLKVEH